MIHRIGPFLPEIADVRGRFAMPEICIIVYLDQWYSTQSLCTVLLVCFEGVFSNSLAKQYGSPNNSLILKYVIANPIYLCEDMVHSIVTYMVQFTSSFHVF